MQNIDRFTKKININANNALLFFFFIKIGLFIVDFIVKIANAPAKRNIFEKEKNMNP